MKRIRSPSSSNRRASSASARPRSEAGPSAASTRRAVGSASNATTSVTFRAAARRWQCARRQAVRGCREALARLRVRSCRHDARAHGQALARRKGSRPTSPTIGRALGARTGLRAARGGAREGPQAEWANFDLDERTARSVSRVRDAVAARHERTHRLVVQTGEREAQERRATEHRASRHRRPRRQGIAPATPAACLKGNRNPLYSSTELPS